VKRAGLNIILSSLCGEQKRQNSLREAVLGNYRWQSKQSRLELGLSYVVDPDGRTLWIADAHRGDGKRFVVRAEEKLTAFLELEAAICRCADLS
jgi:hypothetical protein